MPIKENGKIEVKTPTDLLVSAMEKVADNKNIEHAIVILAGKETTPEGNVQYSSKVMSTCNFWEIVGIIESVRDDLR